jgi:hypothetical protein
MARVHILRVLDLGCTVAAFDNGRGIQDRNVAVPLQSPQRFVRGAGSILAVEHRHNQLSVHG